MFAGISASAQNYVNKNAEELLASTKEPSSERKRLLMCTTISCCSIGSFGIEIWSDKECHYIITNSKIAVVDLKNRDGSVYKESQIEVKEDVTLIDKNNTLEKDGLEAVMKAGLYQVINGQVAFEPTVQKIRVKAICYQETHEGTLFGHHYSYSTSICVVYPSFSRQTKNIEGGYAVIDLTKDEKVLKLARENADTLVFDQDIVVDNKYVIKAGRYSVEEGKIYTRNIQLK